MTLWHFHIYDTVELPHLLYLANGGRQYPHKKIPGHIPVTSDQTRCEDAHSSRVVHIPIPLIPEALRSQGPPLLLTCAGNDQEQVVDSQAPGSYSCGKPRPDANTQLLLQLGRSIERLESQVEKAESQRKIT